MSEDVDGSPRQPVKRYVRRDPLYDAGPVITVFCIGMTPVEISSSIEYSGISAVAVCLDSIELVDVSSIDTDMFVCLSSGKGIGWLKRSMMSQVLPRPVTSTDVVYDVVYDRRVSPIYGACPSVGIIVTVYNRPDVAIPCIESIAERTSFPFREMMIVDDSSDDYTFHRLKAFESSLGDQRVRVFRSDSNSGYLDQANTALDHIFKTCDYAVLVNSDVLVTHGWLTGMVKCAIVCEADLVNPMCNAAAAQSIPFPMQKSHSSAYVPGGRSYIDIGFALSLHSPVYPDAAPSIGQCLLVSERSWTSHGPFSKDIYDRGYGEECEFWANIVNDGGTAKIADNSFVYHESHATHGEEAIKSESQGMAKFISRHGDTYNKSVRRCGDFSSSTISHRSNIAATGPIGLPVGFVATDIGPWGGVMCILRVMEGLEELGFDCGLGYMLTSKASSKQGSMPMKFGPRKFRSPRDFKNWKSYFGWSEGVVFATHFHSVMYLDEVSKSCPVTRAAFWQDREDFFRSPDGDLTVGKEFSRRYSEVPNRIVNASWVGESSKDDLGVTSFTHIPVGVDTDMFYPASDGFGGGKLRVVSMWRPLTPRRGHERLVRIYSALREVLGSGVSLEIYGQDERMDLIEDLIDVHHGWMHQRSISDLLRGVDVVIEPSDFQGFGLPGLEAMASGCLLVSTDNKGIHEYGVDGVNCFISNDEEMILSSVVSAIHNPDDIRRIRARARRDSLCFDWRVICARWAKEILRWDVNWPDGYELEARSISERAKSVLEDFKERV